MGLDNIPHKYPCKAQGTAVLEPRTNEETGEALLDDDGQPWMTINCQATQEAGGCPYQNALSKSGITEGRVYGMFGTDCWYRGKYGNAILAEATDHDLMGDEFSFYGDNTDGSYKSPQSCIELAEFIKTATESYTAGDWESDTEKVEVVAGLRYAEWYLRWAADECDGLECWY